MGKHKDSERKASKKGVKEPHIDLEILEELGGEKEDLDLFLDIDDEKVDIECEEDMEAEPIKRDQIRDYIKMLGFDKIKNSQAESEADLQKVKEEQLEGGDSNLVVKQEKKEKKKKNKFKDNEEISSPGISFSDLVEEKLEADIKVESSSKREKREKGKKNKFKDAENVQVEEVSSTTADSFSIDFIEDHVPLKHLVVKPGLKWYDYGVSDDVGPLVPLPVTKVTRLKDHMTKLHQEEVELYRKFQQNSRRSDSAWTHKVLSSGTLADKMAAWTLLVQEAPVHNMACLDHLVTMVNKKGRREALLAIDTLKELFLTELLCDHRKLRTFEQHPLHHVEELAGGNKVTRDKRLLLWYCEDRLKQKYAEFIHGLETVCHDNLREAKQKAIATVFALLAGKPEQEKKLLSLLCNKLGDPDYKVASNTAHLLINLVQRHPNMKLVIVSEVERLMYRPNMAAKAQYYAVCFLNQILLSPEDTELAVRLINIYFSFFKSFVKKGEVDSKMLSALLTGVNRAYPYTKGERGRVTEQLDTLYRVVHVVNFNTSVQALMLLYQVIDSSESSSDRYYQALYRKLLDTSLITSSKQTLFLNLLFKSMKQDTVERRVKAFIKRLLQVCCGLPPPFICGSLILLSEIMNTKPGLFQFSQFSQDSDDEHFDDADSDDEHFDDADSDDEHFDDADFDDEHFDDADSDDEHFDDADSDDEIENLTPEQKQGKDTQNALGHTGHMTTSSWVHRRNISGVAAQTENYDGHHRNPLYCHAERECVWELNKLTNHYHPSVALFASNILQAESIHYPGDPLEDFSFMRFLDRFVYKNPKKRERESRGNQSHTRLQVRHQGAAGARAVAVNSVEYLRRRDIPAEEHFFHRYFKSREVKKVAKETEETSDVSDEEFDDFLDDYEKGMDGADFDFAGEFTKGAAKKKIEKADDEDDLDDDLDGLSDEEVDFGNDEDFRAAFEDMDDDDIEGDDLDGDDLEEDDLEGDDLEGDMEDDEFDEEAVDFSDEDEFSSEPRQTKRGSASNRRADSLFMDEPPPSKKKRLDKHVTASLFAAAEEFGDVMDENVSTKVSSIGSEAMSNKDKAGVKQLKWEQSRSQWLQGSDWKSRKRGKPGQARGKPGQAREKSEGKFGNKSRIEGNRDKGSFGVNKGSFGANKGSFGAKKGGKPMKNFGNKRGKQGAKRADKRPRKAKRS